MTFFHIDGITIHWFTARRTDGSAIVFGNWLGTGGRVWAGLARLLGGRHPIVTNDWRGRGLTDVPEKPYSIEGLANDILALADHTGLRRSALVGGPAARRVALKAPKRRFAHALCDTAVKIDIAEASNARIEAIRKSRPSSIANPIMERPFASWYRGQRQDDHIGTHRVLVTVNVEIGDPPRPPTVAADIDAVHHAPGSQLSPESERLVQK